MVHPDDQERLEAYSKETAKKFQKIFDSDSRFIYRDLISFGVAGSAHRIQHIQKDHGTITGVKDFIVKQAYENDFFATFGLKEETVYLKAMRGCMHIGQSIDIVDDPLSLAGCPGKWLFLEWIPNGTLATFIDKAKAMGVKRFPNRLLWRFFLCLVRACCAMAWPRNYQDGRIEIETPLPDVDPIGLTHNDLHSNNIVLGEGDLDIGGEHGISPVLKVIDFGQSGIIEPDDPYSTIASTMRTNMTEIADIMMQLIAMDISVEWNKKGTIINYLGQDIETRANAILPAYQHGPSPYPWLDEWMATIISLLLAAEQEKHMPTLPALTNWVVYACRNRTAEFYNNPAVESDGVIIESVKKIIYDAKT
ncbi:hypothetical protein M426DRAFT_10589 [Hypoxylon sp. CI-4A]|nr:hypothetical protein M426DRAFT_10589 [Hypoxylon sp. CI-4A]